MNSTRDPDPIETVEWRDAFSALLQAHGPQRARQMLDELAQLARQQRIDWTPELATPLHQHDRGRRAAGVPGRSGRARTARLADALERALAMVVRANHSYGELGVHIASYASAADLF